MLIDSKVKLKAFLSLENEQTRKYYNMELIETCLNYSICINFGYLPSHSIGTNIINLNTFDFNVAVDDFVSRLNKKIQKGYK